MNEKSYNEFYLETKKKMLILKSVFTKYIEEYENGKSIKLS